MKNAGKRQGERNEDTYKTNVTNQRNRETKPDQRRYGLNYQKYNDGTELIVYANEHSVYKKGHKTKEANYAKRKQNTKLKSRILAPTVSENQHLKRLLSLVPLNACTPSCYFLKDNPLY